MPPPGLQIEKEFLRQLIAGDATAFRKIYELYQGKLFLYTFRFTKSKSAAEEIVQEVFVRIWERRAQIDEVRNFNAYILRITKNLLIDGLKKAALDRNLQEKIHHSMQALKSTPADELIEKEIARLYQQALDTLTPSQKNVFLLSREEELSYDEIAQKLNIAKNTVRNQMSDALRSIREYLTSHPDLACLLLAVFSMDHK